MKLNLIRGCVLILTTMGLMTHWPVHLRADVSDVAALSAVVDDLKRQMEHMQAIISEQAQKIKVLEARQPEVKAVASPVESGMGEGLFQSMFDERLEEKIGGADEWLKDLDFKGDLRLRWEPSDRTDGPDKANDRNRFRYRLRFGWEKKFHPHMTAGFGLASQAANTEAGSTNTTFDDSFTFKPISIEKVYATYQPGWAEVGPIKKVEMTGGKFANPFLEGSSRVVWDPDVMPEGFYQKIVVQPIDTLDFDLDVYGLAGQLILEEASASGDAELFAWQLGAKSVIEVGMTEPVELKNVFSYYNYSDFTNLTSDGGTSVANGNPSTIVTNTAGGLSAEDFDVVEIYNEAKLTPFAKKYPIRAFFDWATNVSNGALTAAGGELDKAWALGLKLGKAKEQGTWELGYEYRYIDPNAVVGQFVDSDFGFANKRGSVFSAQYAVTDRLTAGLTGFFTNSITADSGAVGILSANRLDEETRLFLLDLIWKF